MTRNIVKEFLQLIETRLKMLKMCYNFCYKI